MNINWTKWGTISGAITLVFTAIMLILVTIQVLPILEIRIPMDFFHENSYEIYALTDPFSSDSLPKLHVSPIYYVEISADMPKTANYNKDIKFIINTIDKGKNHINAPKLKAIVVDSVGNIRGVFPDFTQNLSGVNISLNRKITLIFHPAPSDQKIIGIWKLYIYIFGESSKELVSYGVYEFNLTEEDPFVSNLILLLIPAVAALITLIIYRYLHTREYKGLVSQDNIISDAVATDSEKIERYFQQWRKQEGDNIAVSSSDMNEEEKTGAKNVK